jgi:hypothetical protein
LKAVKLDEKLVYKLAVEMEVAKVVLMEFLMVELSVVY